MNNIQSKMQEIMEKQSELYYLIQELNSMIVNQSTSSRNTNSTLSLSDTQSDSETEDEEEYEFQSIETIDNVSPNLLYLLGKKEEDEESKSNFDTDWTPAKEPCLHNSSPLIHK
jgi:hypothetical protein